MCGITRVFAWNIPECAEWDHGIEISSEAFGNAPDEITLVSRARMIASAESTGAEFQRTRDPHHMAFPQKGSERTLHWEDDACRVE
jgi:hypothetical protein